MTRQNGLHATMLPEDLSGSGWYEVLEQRPSFPRLESNIRAEWLIVGAGFAGLSAARQLVRNRPGERVVVIDAQRIAWGAAGRNSGFMIDLPHELNSDTYAGGREDDLRQIEQNRAAIAFARDAAEEFGLTEHLSPIGKLHGAADSVGQRALERFSAHLMELRENWTSLDADDMRGITGTTYYRSGIHTPGALLIQPAAYILGLAQGLVTRHGVSVYEQSPLLRLETGPDHVAHTPHGTVAAPHVILAVNGHIESLGLYRRRLMHVFTYASMTRQLTTAEQDRLGGEPEWGLVPAHPMGTTVRRLANGRIVVRSVFSWNPDRRTSTQQVKETGAVHDRCFATRFPILADVSMEYRWGGHLCLSRNSVPAFGEVEKQVYAAACQNGLGITKGTLSGMLVVDLASGVPSKMLDEWQSQPPPQKLHPEPFMSLGAKAYLKWTHHRAGLDL
jgi:glycine/D-amino acid oxidase-like deaminating enzyme